MAVVSVVYRGELEVEKYISSEQRYNQPDSNPAHILTEIKGQHTKLILCHVRSDLTINARKMKDLESWIKGQKAKDQGHRIVISKELSFK